MFLGLTEVVVALLEAGAPVETIGFRGSTPLMRAANNGHHLCLKALLEVSSLSLWRWAIEFPSDLARLTTKDGWML